MEDRRTDKQTPGISLNVLRAHTERTLLGGLSSLRLRQKGVTGDTSLVAVPRSLESIKSVSRVLGGLLSNGLGDKWLEQTSKQRACADAWTE